MIPIGWVAGLWGLLAGGALVLGATVGYTIRLPRRVVAGVMAFGSGVLISALSFELLEPAYRQGGLGATMVGFAAGALAYSAANGILSRRGAKHRKRSDERQASEAAAGGSGAAIAVGALLDGIPESIAIGLTMLAGGGVSLVTVIAIFVSNIPEGLSSSAGMKTAGRSARFVFCIWIAIAGASGLAALAGYSLFGGLSPDLRALTTAVAAGGVLAMVIDTMVPEAFEGTHGWSGLIAAAGFLGTFALSMLET
ncbi:MAG: ZIP family metal transporter [Thermoanaerobaculia bacterium]